MLITEMILVALQSVRANLFRAFLTMLGIIIGVASVITMIAIGSGAPCRTSAASITSSRLPTQRPNG